MAGTKVLESTTLLVGGLSYQRLHALGGRAGRDFKGVSPA